MMPPFGCSAVPSPKKSKIGVDPEAVDANSEVRLRRAAGTDITTGECGRGPRQRRDRHRGIRLVSVFRSITRADARVMTAAVGGVLRSVRSESWPTARPSADAPVPFDREFGRGNWGDHSTPDTAAEPLDEPATCCRHAATAIAAPQRHAAPHASHMDRVPASRA